MKKVLITAVLMAISSGAYAETAKGQLFGNNAPAFETPVPTIQKNVKIPVRETYMFLRDEVARLSALLLETSISDPNYKTIKEQYMRASDLQSKAIEEAINEAYGPVPSNGVPFFESNNEVARLSALLIATPINDPNYKTIKEQYIKASDLQLKAIEEAIDKAYGAHN